MMLSFGSALLLVTAGCYLQFGGTAAQLNDACYTPSRESGNCIELQQCQGLYQLVTAVNLSNDDRNFLAQSQCGYVNGKVLVCCPERIRVVQPPVSRVGATGGNSGSLPDPPKCGTALVDRIYGGNKTGLFEFPWMALIEYTKPGNVKGHHCGGTLIHDRYVLTAAHCVTGRAIPSDWRLTGVRLGEWDTTTNPDCELDARGRSDCAAPHLDVAVEQVIAHSQYSSPSRNQLNDIALLRLSRSVPSTTIEPICLPKVASLRDSAFTGTAMDVAGWGKTETMSASSLKLKATVHVANLAECRKKYTGQRINLEQTQMCAGGASGIDSCRGDSGGPLMVQSRLNGQDYFFLAGVVSFGPTPCGLSGWPGVYTRVGAYIDWIESNIR